MGAQVVGQRLLSLAYSTSDVLKDTLPSESYDGAQVRDLCFSHDGSLLAVGWQNGTIQVEWTAGFFLFPL